MLKKITLYGICLFTALLVSCRENRPDGPTPDTPDGMTRVVADNWDRPQEKQADISYQLLIYSFADSDGDGIGDLRGVTQKLDYLDSLGVTAIWLSPVHPSMSYHGYDVLDYAAVNPDFGDEEDFRELTRQAHERGIRIYIDYVMNHSGSTHPWFEDASSSEDSPYWDFYIFSENPAADIAAGNIPMIASEGSNGYDAGQWYVAGNTARGVMQFNLDWSNASAPTLTVSPSTGNADAENTAADTENDKYLYLGEPGRCVKFYDNGGGQYSLAVEFDSPWGFLIRTEDGTDWTPGTKYGAQTADGAVIEYGKPFPLYTSQDNNAVRDILMPGTQYYHSHMWTSWFADLNYGPADQAENSPAFKALVDIGAQWIDRGIDGMRLDAVKHIYHSATSDENPTFLGKFYQAMNSRFSSEEPFYMVGEVFSEHNEVAPYYKGLPAAFDFSFWWRLSSAINSGTGTTFVKDILSYRQEYANYRQDFIQATKLSNHDENRAGSTLEGSQAKMKLAGAVLLTAGGSPYIYYGEELGYTGLKDNGDEYVRLPMNWGDNSTTSLSAYSDKTDVSLPAAAVSEQVADEASVYRVYRDFAAARNAFPALGKGEMVRHELINESLTSSTSLCAWYMDYEDERALVIHNFGGQEINFVLSQEPQLVIAVQGDVYSGYENGARRLQMGPYSSVVFDL